MNPKRIRDFIFNEDNELHDRQFVLVMTITISMWFVILIELIFAGGTYADILSLGAGILLFAVVTWLSVRHRRIRGGAIALSVGLCFIYVPINFFYGGGLHGDAPLWFLYGIFFVSLSLSKKTKLVMLILDGICGVVCWGISYFHPEYIIPNSDRLEHIYSVVALVLISAAISVMISFQNLLNRKENERSRKQTEEIEALNKSQNQFFSSMSHEIRTPINTIIGLNEMILREDISDEVAEDAANIQAASKMLLHLINDILDMSKFASGQMQLTPVNYHPGDMLSEIVAMLWLKAKEKNLEFHVNIAPDIPAELYGDEVRIKQILINMVNNAIKYTKEGSVSLSIQCGERHNNDLDVVYTVSDTGIGIKKENIPYLFTAFKRVDEEKNRRIEGTGLGLSIVKQFVDLMGGKITVNSIYTKGSTFIVEIPQRIIGDQQIGEVDVESRNLLNRRKDHKTKFEAPEARILVVDDNASNLMVVNKLLRETKVQIDSVTSGAEALKKTLNQYYQVIFMDHLMPEMDGIECHRAIRTQVGGRCRHSKVVALTANAGGEIRALYEQEGFDGYLVKPVTGDEIEKELYRLLPSDLTIVSGGEDEILSETISWMKQDQQKRAVAITTESVADLPQEILDQYGIAVLPHLVTTENGTFKDGIEIETNGLLRYMEDEDKKVITRGPEVGVIEAFFAKQLEGANNIIHLAISRHVANSGGVLAMEAAKAFDNVTVIDSGHLSSGQGLMVVEACRLVEQGKSPEEIVAHLEGVRDRIHTSFIVNNLDFLARQEQISGNIAGITKSLMARPVLVIKKGKLRVGNVFFGARERAWERYISSVLRRPDNIDKRILFVTYVGLTKKDMDLIREMILERASFKNIYFQSASPAIAVNCGPGTFGLLTRDEEWNDKWNDRYK